MSNKLTFEIDSHQKISGSDGDFLYGIKMPSLEQADAKGLSVVCLSATLPKTYYTIPSGRNTFTVTEAGTVTVLTITPGFYNATTFRTALIAALATLTKTYTVSVCSPITAKYSFSFTGGGVVTFTMPDTNGSGIHECFGLEKNTTYTLPMSSVNVVNFSSKASLQIHSDMVGGASDILVSINASANANMSSIAYQCPQVDAYAKSLATKNGNVFRFYVTDEDGNIIDFNGNNTVFSIMVFAPIDGLIEAYLKAKIVTMANEPQ